MIICTIGNKCLSIHDKIITSISKLAEEHNTTLNILKKYSPTEFTAEDLFYNHVDKDKLSKDEREYFVTNMYTLPKINCIDEYTLFFEYINKKEFMSALMSDDIYIIDVSEQEFRTLYSYIKVFHPSKVYRLSPIFVKSGSEYDRLINMIDRDMSPEEIHYYCRLLISTYEMKDSKIPEGFGVDSDELVDEIIKNTLMLTNKESEEFKVWENISSTALDLIYKRDK